MTPLPEKPRPEWNETVPGVAIASEASLELLLTGGQAFRWRKQAEGLFKGVFGCDALWISRSSEGSLLWKPVDESKAPQAGRLARIGSYFRSDTDFEGLRSKLLDLKDSVLSDCLSRLPPIRLLRQPFGETLLCYLCSPAKRLEQIRQCCEAFALHFGNAIAPGVHALPTWQQLAEVPPEDLKITRAGYRTRFIAETAQFLKRNPGWLEEVERQPYAQARLKLLELPGVGEKIADCVLLYGGGHLDSFPSDTWIVQVIRKHYPLAHSTPQHIARFGRERFGSLAGLAQQYFFEAGRLGYLKTR